MKTQYIEKNFKAQSLWLIQTANEIIEEYQAEGMSLTLRQLYYQFVSRGMIPNKQREYKKLGSVISDGRLAGLIDWEAIEDRTRYVRRNSHFADPADVIRAARYSFQLDHWEGQEYRVEVWIEKEALTGVISGICEQLDVPYFACKGYVSQSEMWKAAQRLLHHLEMGRAPVIIHLGDHDPSGIDMTRDIIDRNEVFEADMVEVERIALNMDQVEEYNPPPNPAKLSDTRSSGYISKYGNESWELDALEPRVLRRLIEEKVVLYRDDRIYQDVLNQESEYIEILKRVERDWQSL